MSEHLEQFKKIGLGFLIALLVFLLSITIFDPRQSSLLALIAFLVTLWTNEGLPLAVVSLLPIVLFPAFGILNTKATAMNYSNPIIFLFLGGFLLAIAVEKSKLHIWIADKILSFFPSTPRAMIFSLALTSALSLIHI